MYIIIRVAVSFLFLVYVQSLHLSLDQQQKELKHAEQKSLRRVLQSLANFKSYLTSGSSDRRSMSKLERARNVFDVLSKKMGAGDIKKILREVAPTVEPAVSGFQNIDYEHVVEQELENTETKHSSILLDKAYVEKKGRNDFLVMKPLITDPFVTIVPNNIYYGIEKKCVNWLDDCSLQGIRARLLERVQWPYK